MEESNKKLIKAIKHYQDSLERHTKTGNSEKLLHAIEKLDRLPIKVCHLEETGVGRTVNSLKKFDGIVGETARTLVDKWKTMVKGEEDAEEEQARLEQEQQDLAMNSAIMDMAMENKIADEEPDPESLHIAEEEHSEVNSELLEINNLSNKKSISSYHKSRSSSKHLSRDKRSQSQDRNDKKSRRHHSSEDDNDKSSDSDHKSKKQRKDQTKHCSDEESGSESGDSGSSRDSSPKRKKDKKKSKHSSSESSESSSSDSEHSDEEESESDNHRSKYKSKSQSSDKKHRKKHSSASESDSKRSKESKSKDKKTHSLSEKDRNSESKDRHRDSKDKSSGKSDKGDKDKEHSSRKDSSSSKNKEQSVSDSKHKSDKEKSKHHRSDKDLKKSSKSDDKNKDKSSKESSSKSRKDKDTGSSNDKKRHRESSSERESKRHKGDELNEKKDKKSKHSSSSKNRERETSDKKRDKSRSDDERHRESSTEKEFKKTKDDRKKKDKKSEHSSSSKGKEKESSDKKKDTKDKSSRSDEDKHKKSDSSSSTSKPSKDKEKLKVKASSSKSTSSVKLIGDGIDSGSGASFGDVLGMLGPAVYSKSKKKSIGVDKNLSGTKDEKPAKSRSSNEASHSSSEIDEVPSLLKDSGNLQPLDINISSLLPSITPNYRPLNLPLESPNKKMWTDEEALTRVITAKHQRTKVYSGNKSVYSTVPSLFDICSRILQDNLDALEYTGGVPYSILKPILEKANPDQLYQLEFHNAYLVEDTDELWQLHCQKDFRNKKREELESWREMYMRCLDEREAKLKALTANIKESQDKSIPVRQTKLAYVDSFVKPPRNIARKQARNGTGVDIMRPAKTPAERLNKLAKSGEASKVAVPNPGKAAAERSSSSSSSTSHSSHGKPKKAPLMAKTLSLMKNRFGRR